MEHVQPWAAARAVCQASDERLHAGYRGRSQRLGLDPELSASPSAMRRMANGELGWRDGGMEESPKVSHKYIYIYKSI